MKKKILWVGLVVLVALALGGWALAQRKGKGTEVQVAKVGREDVQAKVTANGKVQAQKKVDISATIAGQITHLAVQEGDVVKKGQFLLQIDPVNPRSLVRSTESSMEALLQDLQMARSSLAQARADFDRARNNHDSKIISDADFDRARITLASNEAAVNAAQRRADQARATLEGVRDTLSKTTIRSPIDGVVTAKRVEEGEVAVIGVQNSPGTVLLTISDMSVVETEMEVDETSIPAVRLGQKANIRIDAYPNRTFDGEVTEVGSSPINATATGTTSNEAIKFKVKVRILNPPADVKPGLSAQADILTGFRANALVVPIQALVLRDPQKKQPGEVRTAPPKEVEGVYVMAGGKARFVPITTGLTGELAIEVVSGLQGGESVITGPFKALRTLEPGDAVQLEKPKPGEARPAA
jgi:HlyD family secretion protein